MSNIKISITWNAEKDETTLRYNEAFNEAYDIARLDVLSDAIADLQQKYHDELNKLRVSSSKAF